MILYRTLSTRLEEILQTMNEQVFTTSFFLSTLNEI